MWSCGGSNNVPKVVDYTVISTLVEIHKTEQPQYKDINRKEAENLLLQKMVTEQTKENRDIVEKIKQRYVNTNLLLTQVGKLPVALQTIADIKDYQVDILELVKDKPELSLIAIKTEIALIKRVNRLYNYVYLNALVGTDLNRMPIAKRLEIIDYVITELRVIRGFCYSIYRKMKKGKNGNTLNEVLKEFNINSIYGDINKQKIVNDLMKEL
tara:strand:- start:16118 stop:16753 length:636 start_codon:yes stop_codon:yes gene_type:complete